MRSPDLNRFALGVCVPIIMLVGCGGSQPPIGAPGAVPQTSANATHTDRGKSWMLPEAKSEDLIYATGGCAGTCVISYPKGREVGSLNTRGLADCSDANGNVFISSDATVAEYSHGGTSPIDTLDVPGDLVLGCSVDPTTGDLAVVFRGGSGTDIAVFANAKGTPTLYASQIIDATFCGYDNTGNLFINGFNEQSDALSELPTSSSVTTKLTISGSLGEPGQMQWDGSHMTFESMRKGDINVARLSLSGTTATVVGKTHFKGLAGNASQSWIWGKLIFVPFGRRSEQNKIGVWKYPGGGKPQQKYTESQGAFNFQGVTVSVAPH